MATLDRVMQMQQEGVSDNDIMTRLNNEGISAGEIRDALNHAKIKGAISPSNDPTQSPGASQNNFPPAPNAPEPAPTQTPDTQPPITTAETMPPANGG